jgi:hypothetical protein
MAFTRRCWLNTLLVAAAVAATAAATASAALKKEIFENGQNISYLSAYC